jgi:hypothetical protein
MVGIKTLFLIKTEEKNPFSFSFCLTVQDKGLKWHGGTLRSIRYYGITGTKPDYGAWRGQTRQSVFQL